MKAIDIIDAMNKWASPKLIEEWDNTGFQIGDINTEISKILVSLDLDREAYKEAVKFGAQMIITHHPFIFKPLKSILYSSYKGKLIHDIIKKDIVVYNAHTNLDLAKGGVNDVLANILCLDNIEPLKLIYKENLYKLVVFVPKSHAQIVRDVLGKEGAGYIGNYSHCTYNLEGIGTFLPLEGTSPFIGEINKLEEVEEIRIETIVKEKDLNKVIDQMLLAHPYEEVAYDVYPLLNKGDIHGYGRIGDVEEIELCKFLDIVKDKLNVDKLFVYGNLERKVKRVALCGGSGSSFIFDANQKGADVYLTGDVKYHDAQYANELGLTIIDAGHFHTEKVILKEIENYIKKEISSNIDIKIHDKMSPQCVLY